MQISDDRIANELHFNGIILQKCTYCVSNYGTGSWSIAYTSTPQLNNYCGCAKGWTVLSLDERTCQECSAGQYKNFVDTLSPNEYPLFFSPCSTCVAGTYSAAGAASCTVCPANSASSASSTSITSCECNGGYYGSFGGDCTKCPINTVSPASSTTVSSCKCKSGSWGGVGVTCTECLAGTFKSSADSAASLITSCGPCSENTYSAVGASTCTGCPVNTVSLAGSRSCGCKGGYHGNLGGPCTVCGAGTFKPSADTTTASNADSCTLCPEGSFNTDIGSSSVMSCTACPAGTTSPFGSSSITSCICNIGYLGNGATALDTPIDCVACAYGKYGVQFGSAPRSRCALCNTGQITAS
ncbi:hypothetical protein T484DRAFT_1649498, partial [Baffinella frigidus]